MGIFNNEKPKFNGNRDFKKVSNNVVDDDSLNINRSDENGNLLNNPDDAAFKSHKKKKNIFERLFWVLLFLTIISGIVGYFDTNNKGDSYSSWFSFSLFYIVAVIFLHFLVIDIIILVISKILGKTVGKVEYVSNSDINTATLIETKEQQDEKKKQQKNLIKLLLIIAISLLIGVILIPWLFSQNNSISGSI